MSTRHAVVDTDLGALTFVVDDDGLSGLYFPGHWTRPDTTRWGPAVDAAGDAAFAAPVAQLAEYLRGERREFDLALHPVGGELAQRVWTALTTIPYGTTTTYGDLARRVDVGHARAVGRFVGANPIGIVVPCHRVVGSDGSLTGYAGGLERKRALLEIEGASVTPPALF